MPCALKINFILHLDHVCNNHRLMCMIYPLLCLVEIAPLRTCANGFMQYMCLRIVHRTLSAFVDLIQGILAGV